MWQNLTPERVKENINFSKNFICSSGDRTHNQSVLQSHFVPLRHDWPQQLYIIMKSILKLTESVKQINVHKYYVYNDVCNCLNVFTVAYHQILNK